MLRTVNKSSITNRLAHCRHPGHCRWRSSKHNRHKVSHYRCWCTEQCLDTWCPSFDDSAVSSGSVRTHISSAWRQHTSSHWRPGLRRPCKSANNCDSLPTWCTRSCRSPASRSAAAAQTSAGLFKHQYHTQNIYWPLKNVLDDCGAHCQLVQRCPAWCGESLLAWSVVWDAGQRQMGCDRGEKRKSCNWP